MEKDYYIGLCSHGWVTTPIANSNATYGVEYLSFELEGDIIDLEYRGEIFFYLELRNFDSPHMEPRKIRNIAIPYFKFASSR